MVKEDDAIRTFVLRQLRQCSDLSSLTLGVLRRRYLEEVARESLSIKERQLMKTIVEEELLKMQDSSDDEPLVKFVEKKRKRVDCDADDGDEGLNEMKRKKRSRHEESPPDSPDSGIVKAMNDEGRKDVEDGSDKESEEEKEKVETKVKQQKQNLRRSKEPDTQSEVDIKTKKRQNKQGKKKESEEEDELNDSDEGEEEPKEKATAGGGKKKGSAGEEKTTKNRSIDSSSDSEDERERTKERKIKNLQKKNTVEIDAVKEVERQVFGSSSESEEENTETTNTKKSSKNESEGEDAGESSFREEKKGKTTEEDQGKLEEDSDSSSLPSLEDDEEQVKIVEEKKQKSVTKTKRSEEKEKTPRGKDENKTVTRLKQYIALCGARRNYKKLLGSCKSIKAKVNVLKKELEDLGVEGPPTKDKCKKARLKREEAQEVAELDISNIITTQGRPKRRACSVGIWPPPQNISTPSSAYKRIVDSDSDSEDSHTNRGHKKTTAWSNLRGIISDDGESD